MNKLHYTIIEPSPFKQYGDFFIAVQSNSNDKEHYLKVLKFDPAKDENQFDEISSIRVSEQITSLGWTTFGCESEKEYLGLLMAGHGNGALSLWSVTQLINIPAEKPNHGLLKIKTGIHNSRVNNIKYNNEKVNIAATASSEVVIVQIKEEDNDNYDLEIGFVCENDEDKTEVTSVAWNDAVNFIIAVAYSSSMVYIWDIKKKSIRFRIRDQSMTEDKSNVKTNAVWSSDGMFIIISYDDPEFNFLTQYNISQLTAPYAEYHGGHKKSITALKKNPNDPNILLSLGKDNCITCWSIRTQKVYSSFQKDEKTIQVVWSPKFPDCFVSLSDNSVEMNQVNFSNNPSIYLEEEEELPRWMTKKSLSAFAWGGKFLTVNEKLGPVATIHSLNSGNELTQTISEYVQRFNEDKGKYLDLKTLMTDDNLYESQILFIALKCLQNKNFNELFKAFGYDKEKLIEEAGRNVNRQRKTDKETKKPGRVNLKDQLKANKFAAKDIFDTAPDIEPKNSKSSKKVEVEKEEPNTIKVEILRNLNWNMHNEKCIKSSLLAGDLELAMENAFKADRDAEALLIASSDPELFQKAKQEYLKKSSDIFIKNVFASIINKNFNHLLNGNMKDWKEYLLYGLTYLDKNEFIIFTKSLGEKLLSLGDFYSSLVCFLLGYEGGLVIEKLYQNYKTQVEQVFTNEEKEQLLHILYEQISLINFVFHENCNSEITNTITVQYCELLVNHKLYTEACNLLVKLKNPEINTLLLFDRIYGNNEDKFHGSIKRPNVPFKEIHVKPYVSNKKPKLGTNVINNNAVASSLFGANNKAPLVPNPSQKQPEPESKIPKPTMRPSNPKPNFPQPILSANRNEPVVNPNPITTSSFQPQPQMTQQVQEEKEVKRSFQNSQKQIQPPKPKFPIQQPPVSQQISTQPVQTFQSQKQEIPNQTQNVQSQQQQQELDEEESRIIQSFERYQEMYNSTFQDDTKQKDMNAKIQVLFQKLKVHDIKPLLKKLLNQFIDSVDSGLATKDLQMLVRKIQANQWDQNKTWMPCLDKIVSMPRK